MPDQSFDEINGRESFFHVLLIFMAVVMESNSIAIISIDSGCSNNRSSKITTDVFDHSFRVRKMRFGINVKAMLMIGVTFGLHFFKRRADDGFHFIQESGAKSIA